MTPDNDSPSRGRRIAYWLCQLGGWGLYVAVGISMAVAQAGPQPVVIVGYVLFFFYSIALTHGLRAVVLRRHWLGLPPGRAALRLGLAAVAVGIVQASLIIGVQSLWTRASPFNVSPRFALFLLLNTTAATLAWTLTYTGLSSIRRVRRARQNAVALELGMREARLQSLEAQVNPHFLFNCLNSVRGLIVENPPRAQDMVTRLANLLRHNLARGSVATEPLADQVAVITDYLELESVRLEERLRTRIDIDPPTRNCQVAWMLLQTLVENAVKHGIARLPDGGEIAVRSRLRDGQLELTVENTGTLGASPAGSTRVGQANLRERLRLLHGPAATLELTAPAPGRVQALARMPALTTAAAPPENDRPT